MPHYRVILHALNYLILELHEYFTVSHQVMKINYNLLNLVTLYNIYRSVKSIDLINLTKSVKCSLISFAFVVGQVPPVCLICFIKSFLWVVNFVQWYTSYRHCTHSFRAGPGWNCNSILILLEAVYKPV
jgi:hypothetical protein